MAKMKNADEFIAQQRQAIAQNPECGNSHYNLGVALMGQARGQYTFFRHLRWTPAIALGYALSIWVHMLVNQRFLGVLPGT